MSTVNLLPQNYIRSRFRRRVNLVFLALFVVVMVGVGAAAVVSERHARYTEQINQRVQREYEEAAKLIEQMQALKQEKATLNQKALATASLMERVPRSALLGIVTNALPEHASLLKLELKTTEVERVVRPSRRRGAPPPQGQTKFDRAAAARQGPVTVVTMRVTGLAHTDVQVARLISALTRCPLVKAADLVYSEEKVIDKKKDIKLREFQVTIELNPEADAIDLGREAPELPAPDAPPPAGGDAGVEL